MTTSIEYFNSTLKSFVNNIISIYPNYEDSLSEYYKELLENEISNEDKYIKRFMRKFGDLRDKISEKDNSLFTESIFFLKNIDFKEIWENEKTSNENKESIWEYIQTLYVIGDTILNDSNKIKTLIEQFQKIRDNEPIDELNNDKEIVNMLKNLSEQRLKHSENEESPLSKGLIGDLAKELSEEIKLEDMDLGFDGEENIQDVLGKLMSGDNSMKFMNLVQNVGNKIKDKISTENIDQSQLFAEAQNMMGMLGNNNPLLNNLMGQANMDLAESNPTRDRLRKKLENRKKQSK